ncbi:nucleotidyltransferase domain-containing protein [Rhodococcus qingshengii]|uniref:nucleotidyltransferase domain-containing protein n=1 Tax=Rhodococcus qingshengii TaxID=334542 RepID=UPI001371CA3C|nr:nucleotidyltransferase domain-containing protein [Rhodococcus qingshengii]MDT9662076.1 nucleotidyltransferase domain-containing protein [Rhodococcus qingshengii]MYV30872.1 nucleotidyltransferase domain-containing protein [Rhodococcus erythropolis]
MAEPNPFESDSQEPESPIDLEAVRKKLADLLVDGVLIEQICTRIHGNAIGVLLYGSWARGEASTTSDLDLLVVSQLRADSGMEGKLSLSSYTPNQLTDARATLFGMHLARDGIVLHDTADRMAEILSTFTPPDPQGLLQRIREFSTVLNLPREEQANYLAGLCQVGRYLLRTAIYVLALRDGRPCFSVEELAVRFNQPELTNLLSSHPEQYPAPSLGVLDDLRQRLTKVVGPPDDNPYGSLHALIVGSSISNPDLENMAILALGVDESLPYAELPKVIL